MEQEILFVMQTLLNTPLLQQNIYGQQDLIKTFLDIWKYRGDKDAVSLTTDQITDMIMQQME